MINHYKSTNYKCYKKVTKPLQLVTKFHKALIFNELHIKLHFFLKNITKNLHISQKSDNFAPNFNYQSLKKHDK